MALSDLIKKIEQDAASEVAAIKGEFEKDRSNALSDFSKYKDDYLEKAKARASKNADRHRERLILRAQSDSTLDLLRKKQELLEKVYHEARKELIGLSADEQVKLYTGIYKSLNIDNGYVIVGKNDTALQSDNFKNALGGKIEIKPEGDFKGGFYLVTGNIRYDNTLDSLLTQARDILQDKLVGMLFSDSKQSGN